LLQEEDTNLNIEGTHMESSNQFFDGIDKTPSGGTNGKLQHIPRSSPSDFSCTLKFT